MSNSRHTYATEMLRAGMSLTAVMKLLGHTSPEMTMQYLDVTLNDLQRAFELARSKPRHLVPQPKVPSAPLRNGLDGVIDSLLATQHVLETFRRTLPRGTSRSRLTGSPTASPKSLSKLASSRRHENGRDWPVMWRSHPIDRRPFAMGFKLRLCCLPGPEGYTQRQFRRHGDWYTSPP